MKTKFKNRILTTVRLIFLCLLINCLHACSLKNGKNIQSTKDKTQVKPVEQSNNKTKPLTTVIPEQDPEGFYWGLRDTATGKLVLNYTYQFIGDFKEGYATVILNRKYGLISMNGKEVIEPQYDSPKTELQCGVMAFEKDGGFVFLYDTTGKSLIPLVSHVTGLLPCQQRITYGTNLYGMMSFNGDTILPFQFTSAYLVPEGFCIASKYVETSRTSLFGLYDLNGKQLLPHAFETMYGFTCGRAIVKKNGKLGIIDETGKELFYTRYSRIDSYFNNYAKVYTKAANGQYLVSIIDKNGREIVPPIYPDNDNFYNVGEGLIALTKNNKYGFIDTSGKVVIPFMYDKISPFSNGIAKVWNGYRIMSYINNKGKEIIPSCFVPGDEYDFRSYFNKHIIRAEDSVQRVFDLTGKETAVLYYNKMHELDENEKSFCVLKNNRWGSLDSNFQVKIPLEYESLESIFPNILLARKDNKVGFISHQGKVIYPFTFDWVEKLQDGDMFGRGLAKVALIDNKIGLINSRGKLIVPVLYDEINPFSCGLALVKRNNKYGFVNIKGKEVIAPIYDRATSFSDNVAEVTLKGETYQIDTLGNRIEEEY